MEEIMSRNIDMTTPHTQSDPSTLHPSGRVAVVGAGGFGRFCIDAYRASGDLVVVAVADRDEAALAKVEASGAALSQDWHAVVNGDAEVVHVATPPFLRREVVESALNAGKSVFCEKPLALSLEEADGMIALAQTRGVALGVNYVMRHLPAYRLLEQLSASELFGHLRTISFQNFAQSLPPGHWFWDQQLSGGIFVEHGVHFFDAYGRIAGAWELVTASTPRPEAVEAHVAYRSGVAARYYHEFAFPGAVERTLGTSFFERGYVEIEGWIPTRLSGAVVVPAASLQALGGEASGLTLTPDPLATRFSIDYPDRTAAYRMAVVTGMRDIVRRHRDDSHTVTVPIEDARESLGLALACRHAVTTGIPSPG